MGVVFAHGPMMPEPKVRISNLLGTSDSTVPWAKCNG
jgi:hypothetical protein